MVIYIEFVFLNSIIIIGKDFYHSYSFVLEEFTTSRMKIDVIYFSDTLRPTTAYKLESPGLNRQVPLCL